MESGRRKESNKKEKVFKDALTLIFPFPKQQFLRFLILFGANLSNQRIDQYSLVLLSQN